MRTFLLTKNSEKYLRHLRRIVFILMSAIVFSVYTPDALSQTKESYITLNDVLLSSAKFFPAIKIAEQKVESARGKRQESEGNFDTKVSGEYYDRLTGNYSSQSLDFKVEKPLRQYNAKLLGGYRVSDGEFPIYEDYFYTNDGGEANVGVVFSVLRNSLIDPARFALKQSEIDIKLTEITLLQEKIRVQENAYKAYLEWLAQGYRYLIYQDLLKIAEKRQKALSQRAKKGDIAKIALTENKQFILNRTETALDAKRKFTNAANSLSLYIRNEDADAIIADITKLPKSFPKVGSFKDIENGQAFANILNMNPSVIFLKNENEKINNNRLIAENTMKPNLDVALYAANDFGQGPTARDDFETRAKINFSVPLQRNKGLGMVAVAEAEKIENEMKITLAEENLRIAYDNVLNNIKAARKILSVTEDEISVTKKMENAERKMFDNGQSDFFLVNIREVNAAVARINNIEAKKQLAMSYANYLAMTLDLGALKITR